MIHSLKPRYCFNVYEKPIKFTSIKCHHHIFPSFLTFVSNIFPKKWTHLHPPASILGEDHLVEVDRQKGEHKWGQHHHALDKKGQVVRGKRCQKAQKRMGKPWKNGDWNWKWWGNWGKHRENDGKMMRKSWENHRKTGDVTWFTLL